MSVKIIIPYMSTTPTLKGWDFRNEKNMKKKKSKTKNVRLIDLHMYGIFDLKKETIVKVSLDKSDIQMEYALLGDENFAECEFNIKLAI